MRSVRRTSKSSKRTAAKGSPTLPSTENSPEEERLIQQASPFLQDLIVFGLHTGLRVGEIFSLRWSDVDLGNSLLNVLAQKTGKTRTVPIDSRGMKVLRAWELNRKNDLVFYNCQTGDRFVDLKAGFAIACRKAKIDGVSWHTLRHTFASRLLESGADIVTVQPVVRSFNSNHNYALCPQFSRFQASCRRKAGKAGQVW